jgi:hypothetical protein
MAMRDWCAPELSTGVTFCIGPIRSVRSWKIKVRGGFIQRLLCHYLLF